MSLALFQACRSPQPAGHLAPLCLPLSWHHSARSPGGKHAQVSLCLARRARLAQASGLPSRPAVADRLLAEGPTSSPRSTETAHARSVGVLSCRSSVPSPSRSSSTPAAPVDFSPPRSPSLYTLWLGPCPPCPTAASPWASVFSPFGPLPLLSVSGLVTRCCQGSCSPCHLPWQKWAQCVQPFRVSSLWPLMSATSLGAPVHLLAATCLGLEWLSWGLCIY